MIQFENPAAFLFLLAIPALYVLRHFGFLTHIYFPLTISDWGGKTFSYNDSFTKIFSAFSHILALFAFSSLVISLANPVIRNQEKVFTSRGTDILFVLDTSPSMAARDILLAPSQITRIEAAKIGIRTLLRSGNGSNYGLVAMGSEAACIVPPTGDTELFLQQLSDLEVGEFGDGSAIGIGLSSAVYHLVSSAAPKKCIVLITDGENNAGSVHPETAARLASENSITLYTFGIGTKGSVPIEYFDKKTGKIHSGFYESDFDTAPLEKIAGIADGSYFGIDSTESLSAALSEISQREDSAQTFYYKSNDIDCYKKFLFLAVILFFAAWFTRRIVLSEIL